MEPRHVFTVSELNSTARATLEQTLGTIWVQGEISGLTRAPSGHLYFTLKDETSELSAVRFRSRVSSLSAVAIESGMMVLAQGSLTIYEPRGRYQFVVSILQPLGAGALQRAFERLKKKLSEEGLFAPEAKQALPAIPGAIGVITSPQGAALRDIESVLSRRWPSARVFLFPSTVQGDIAPVELREALNQALRFSESHHPIDLLILTRGGGSAEDLAAFNNEELARALFACPLPVISAVGHEIDFSICDFVADQRAPTPSAAAEMAVPDRSELLRLLSSTYHRMTRHLHLQWRARLSDFRLSAESCLMRSPQRRFNTYEQCLDLSLAGALRSIASQWRESADLSGRLADILRLSDPRLPLQRGYTLTYRAGESKPLRHAADVTVGDPIETHLADGRLISRIQEVDARES